MLTALVLQLIQCVVAIPDKLHKSKDGAAPPPVSNDEMKALANITEVSLKSFQLVLKEKRIWPISYS